MKKITCFLLICAVCSSVQAQGTPVLPYMSTWIRTLFDDETQAAAQTTLGLGTGDSPTFAGLTVSGNSVLTANSAVFQPDPFGDNSTFFQILDKDAGAVVLNVDTDDNIVTTPALTVTGNLGINTATPAAPIEIVGTNAGGETTLFQVTDTAGYSLKMGTYRPGGWRSMPGIWCNQAAPTDTNYTFLSDDGYAFLMLKQIGHVSSA